MKLPCKISVRIFNQSLKDFYLSPQKESLITVYLNKIIKSTTSTGWALIFGWIVFLGEIPLGFPGSKLI